MEVPNKYIYPNPNNGKYEVFVEGSSARPLGDEPLNLKEVQDLAKFAVESHYTDTKADNFLRNPENKKLVIIDTEDMSFFRKATKRDCVESLMRNIDRGLLKVNKDARSWVVSYLKKLKTDKEGEVSIDMYASPRYNKLHVKAENTEKLKRALWKQQAGQDGFLANLLWRMKHAVQSR